MCVYTNKRKNSGILKVASEFHFSYYANLSEFFNFYSPWNYPKAKGDRS